MADMNHTSRQDNLQGKAPSEKHLEDWIVNNLPLFGETTSEEWWVDSFIPYLTQIACRQLNLTVGRPDLIAVRDGNRNIHPTGIVVVELKAGNIGFDTLGQCLRYMAEVRHIHAHAIASASVDIQSMEYDQQGACPNFAYFPYVDYIPVTGIIVGHKCTDSYLPMIAEYAGVSTILYEYDPQSNQYSFKECGTPSNATLNDYDEYAAGALGDAMRYAAQIQINNHRERKSQRGGAS